MSESAAKLYGIFILVALLGAVLNFAVLTANGLHMPVAPHERLEPLPTRCIWITDDTRLPWLGDVINVSNKLTGTSFASPGDILMFLGALSALSIGFASEMRRRN